MKKPIPPPDPEDEVRQMRLVIVAVRELVRDSWYDRGVVCCPSERMAEVIQRLSHLGNQ